MSNTLDRLRRHSSISEEDTEKAKTNLDRGGFDILLRGVNAPSMTILWRTRTRLANVSGTSTVSTTKACDKSGNPIVETVEVPAVAEETVPAVSEETVPAVSEETVPTVSEETVPTVSEETVPAVSESGEVSKRQRLAGHTGTGE